MKHPEYEVCYKGWVVYHSWELYTTLDHRQNEEEGHWTTS